MKISELIEALQKTMDDFGDVPVVYGFDVTGYGNEIVEVSMVSDAIDINGVPTPVVDLLIDESSLVAVSW